MILFSRVLVLLLTLIASNSCMMSKQAKKIALPLPPFISLSHIGIQNKGVAPVVIGVNSFEYRDMSFVQYINIVEFKNICGYLSGPNHLINIVAPPNANWGNCMIIINRESHVDTVYTTSPVDSKKIFQSVLERITDPGEDENNARHALETLIQHF